MKEINLKSKRFILKRISKSDASKKYLSWFKDYQVKEFIENSGTIESIKDLKNNIEKENLKKVENLDGKKSKLFSYLIVFFISFVALIILVDTLKTPLINVFPGLEVILFNLFETLKDIKLFIIDLI